MGDKRRREYSCASGAGGGARFALMLALFVGQLPGSGSQQVLHEQQQQQQVPAVRSREAFDDACGTNCHEAKQLPLGVHRLLQEGVETPSPVSAGEVDEGGGTPAPAPSDEPDSPVASAGINTFAPSDSSDTPSAEGTLQPSSAVDGDFVTQPPLPTADSTEPPTEQTTESPAAAPTPEPPTELPVMSPTQTTAAPPTESPATASTETPVMPSAMVSPATPIPTETPSASTAAETPSTPTATETPAMPTAAETPAMPTAAGTPAMPTAAGTPAMPTAAGTPVVPTATETPAMSTTTETPAMPTAMETPSTPIPTGAPAAPGRGVSAAPTTGTVPAPSAVASLTPAPVGTPPPFAPSTCADGVTAGISSDNVCCKQECGQCGGEGCSNIPGTNGASDCCSGTIVIEGAAMCGEAPCIMEGFTPSPVNPAFVGTASPVVSSECSNGLPGYQDRDVCCLLACGQCGGPGCGTIPGTGGSSNCCSTTIREEGVICGQPPCIIDSFTPAPAVVGGGTRAPAGDDLCSNGIAGFQDGAACCEANCGQCGGAGCGSVPGTGGQGSCCSSIIEAQGVSCDVAGRAPCIIDGFTPAPAVPDVGSAAPVVPNWCSNGMSGYQDLDVCCLEACGQCGGAGCGAIPGTPGGEACCSNTIRESGSVCDWNNGTQAPCIIGDWTPSPVNPAFVGTAPPFAPSMCSNGIAGVQNGAACCTESCGQCGGVGCGSIPGTGGSSNCCSSTVLANNITCGEAPCIISDFTPAPAGNSGTLAPYAPSSCTNGLAGYQDREVCCAENCGQCGGVGCSTLSGTGGSTFCCSTTIRANGTDCSISQMAPCIIGDWVPTPSPQEFVSAAPVLPSNCSNGLPGYRDGNVCCKEACGLCGGVGCGEVNGTAGSSDCCPSSIQESGVFCEDGVEAPCIILGTDAPTAAPTVSPPPTGKPVLVEADEFFNTSNGNAAGRTTPLAPVGMMPLVASLMALLGASAFGALCSARGAVKS
ncbi:unnamed protein product [Ascophyllum nodosum]